MLGDLLLFVGFIVLVGAVGDHPDASIEEQALISLIGLALMIFGALMRKGMLDD